MLTIPAANVNLGSVGLFSYNTIESRRKLSITRKSIIKRKFSNISRPPIGSADDGAFDFNESQSTREHSYYSDAPAKIVNPSCNSETAKIHRTSEYPFYDSDPTFSEYLESEIFGNMPNESPRCYICSNNNMVLPNGGIRNWSRKSSSELLKQQGKTQYTKFYKYVLRWYYFFFLFRDISKI